MSGQSVKLFISQCTYESRHTLNSTTWLFDVHRRVEGPGDDRSLVSPDLVDEGSQIEIGYSVTKRMRMEEQKE